MPTQLNASERSFAAGFAAFLRLREQKEESVASVVSPILKQVREQGDAAVIALTEKFDKLSLTPATLAFSKKEIAAARKNCSKEIIKALEHAAVRIRDYHRRQMPKPERYKDRHGNSLGWRWSPLAAVGLYVPGGTASYPSSVLMNAIPAKVAGVERLAMVVPTPRGEVNPAVLAAADIAGVEEIYRIGGAQAVAALAYGTQSIAAVDKIVGPGNAYVAEAKRQVFGKVGIDMIAGPSEILVVADAKNPPEWVAADLLSQAEHDREAQAVLITNDGPYAKRVLAAVENILSDLSRASIARNSWDNYGAVIIVKDWKQALPIIDAIAPEHLELAIEAAEGVAKQVRHAGAIFIGRYTPEAAGDYIAGPSHVLPTSRSARFSSGLGVHDFIKRTSLIACSKQGIKEIAQDAALLADCEGLPAHALSLRHRL